MEVETTKMSSKGQIVIPQGIRKELQADEGTIFAVVGSKDTIILKKIDKPSKHSLIKDLDAIAKEGRRRLERKGLRESDIPDIVGRYRGH